MNNKRKCRCHLCKESELRNNRQTDQFVDTNKMAFDAPWNPMGNAPISKDILVAFENGTIEKLIYYEGLWRQSCDHNLLVNPRGQIGWMPLPAPPTISKTETVQNESEGV